MPGVFDMTTRGLFIDGTQTDASGGAESSVRDPATGQEIARVARASAADVDRAVTVAHRRFQEGVWRSAPVRERRDVLRRIAEAVDAEMLKNLDLLSEVEVAKDRELLQRLRFWERFRLLERLRYLEEEEKK